MQHFAQRGLSSVWACRSSWNKTTPGCMVWPHPLDPISGPTSGFWISCKLKCSWQARRCSSLHFLSPMWIKTKILLLVGLCILLVLLLTFILCSLISTPFSPSILTLAGCFKGVIEASSEKSHSHFLLGTVPVPHRENGFTVLSLF